MNFQWSLRNRANVTRSSPLRWGLGMRLQSGIVYSVLRVKVHSSMTTSNWRDMCRGFCVQVGEKNVTTNSVICLLMRPSLVSFICLDAFWECFSMTSLSVILQHARHVTVTWHNIPVMWQSHDTTYQSCDSHMIQRTSHVTVTWSTWQACDSHMIQHTSSGLETRHVYWVLYANLYIFGTSLSEPHT